ncbi:unnamed protein product [Owenia fusiformis]|uniref:HPS5-like beta-propeller domain-containing protein n=1 Tax=Owenia fusiformis TaxID=6347 RepID=A0A8J1U6L5_OWEFU|nr:unnamed protein product [Owenia fusiformis]
MAEAAPRRHEAGHHKPGLLQEFSPLSHLLHLLPHKAQKGLFTTDIQLLCIDADAEYIALGSNIGIVFLYDRKKITLQRLNCQVKHDSITCVRLQLSLDHLVAAGTTRGSVRIFQLPSNLPGRSMQLQLFRVDGLHSVPVTCLEWSVNGMKLFSGDCDGTVVSTDIDYSQRTSKSEAIIHEIHDLVELSYKHQHLVVSSKHRAAVYSLQQPGKPKQIGTKDRKGLGNYGSVFSCDLCKMENSIIYAARPGFRIWKANIEGQVQATYVFKELIQSETCPGMVLWPDIDQQNDVQPKDGQYGPLMIFNSKHLLSWNSSAIYVLDIEEGTIIGCRGNMGEIVDVATINDEIFVLRKGVDERTVIRISHSPDSENLPEKIHEDLSTTSKILQLDNTPRQSPRVSPRGSPKLAPKSSSNFSPANIFGNMKTKGIKESLPKATQSMKQLFSKTMGETMSAVLGEAPPQTQSARFGKAKEANMVIDSADGIISPDAPLPPVIKLASDDLLQIEIHEPFLPGEVPEENTASSLQAVAAIHQQPDVIPTSQSSDNHSQLTTSSDSVAVPGSDSTEAIDISPMDDIVYKHVKVKKKKQKTNKGDKTSDDTMKNQVEDNVQNEKTEDGDSNEIKDEVKTPEGMKEITDGIDESIETTVDKDLLKNEVNQVTSDKEKDEVKSNDEQNEIPEDKKESLPEGLSEVDTGTSFEDVAQPDVSQKDMSQEEAILNQKDSARTNSFPNAISAPTETSNSTVTSTSSVTSTSTVMSDPIMTSTPLVTTSVTQSANNVPIDKQLEAANIQDNNDSLDILESNNPNPIEESDEFDIYSTSQEDKDKKQQVVESSQNKVQSTSSGKEDDDFYSMFKSRSAYTLSPGTPGTPDTSPEHSSPSSEEAPSGEFTPVLSDTWTEFLAPSNLQSLTLSNKHVWCVDKSERLHYSMLSNPGLKWRKVDAAAKQIAVSATGVIVWRLHKGSAYAGTKITVRNPAGMKWVEAAKDVKYIAVDDRSAWYIKNNGTVFMQQGLSKERPCYRAHQVEAPAGLSQISCYNGIVLAITGTNKLIYRDGLRKGCLQGTSWKDVLCCKDMSVCSVAFGDKNTLWLLDLSGQLWFTTGVTSETPQGSGKCWQVSTGGYLMQETSPLDSLKSMIGPTQLGNLASAVLQQHGGLTASGSNGLWLCLGFKHILTVCRGNLMGHHWEIVNPPGMASTTRWQQVTVAAISEQMWLQQSTGDIFCSSTPSVYISVAFPVTNHLFVCMSATPEALWCLTASGDVYLRTGMAPHCQLGTDWLKLDLSQLDEAWFVHICCGAENVWGVDNSGMVYQRIGVKPPTSRRLPQAWLPVDTQGIQFLQVVTGPCDWMVWGLDVKHNVYVRLNVTGHMPIGTEWMLVSGTTAKQLCVSKDSVWALNDDGEILCRYGISPYNQTGDYWKKIPGRFSKLTVSPSNNLWGIDSDEKLYQRDTNLHIGKQQDTEVSIATRQRSPSDGDWELL